MTFKTLIFFEIIISYLAHLATVPLWFYIALGKVRGGIPPVLSDSAQQNFSNSLPHVLMLTAIVVGVAIIAIGFILVIRIKDK